MKRWQIAVVAAASASLIFGCFTTTALLFASSEKDQLEACAADTEPTILLRQLNLDGPAKEKFNDCTAKNGRSRCQSYYLDRVILIDACMKRNGFVLATPLKADCLLEPDAACFRRKWLEGVHSMIASN